MEPILPRQWLLDRCRLPDRRARLRTLLMAVYGKGGRKRFRRDGESQRAYVACRGWRTVTLAFFVCVGSLLDAFLTLGHLAHGGEEANPLLALALAHSPTLFLQLKIGLTGVGVWVLAAHQQLPLAARGLQGLALGYGTVLVYHLVLCWRLV
jgi:formate hydrogenlyase subunit 3/multisubunit Na+/H+ antiporter MnhD subunit